MADRMLFIGWGESVAGREERGLEVFNDALGFYGRCQQEGRIENFDVVLLAPNPSLGGYIELHGTADQLNELREDSEYQRILAEATTVVQGVSVFDGVTDQGIAEQVEIYRAAINKVPQATA
ncbi:MAG: hypothetical protein ACRDM7_08015 [Thermoleophilaceae bacterium]